MAATAASTDGPAGLLAVSADKVLELRAKLLDNTLPLPSRYRALYALRSAAGVDATESLVAAVDKKAVPSALLRHDVAFCLGQRQDPAAIRALMRLLEDTTEHSMVRHEAGEALGAIGTEECLQPLRACQDDECQEVAETCQLALQRIQYFLAQSEADGSYPSPFMSVDPTPPASASTPLDDLRATVLDESEKMFDRYRALFAIRNKRGAEAGAVLSEIFKSSSALLKHEVAYVLGQMADNSTTEALIKVLENSNEHAMVRHEAAEALGAIAEPWTTELLKKFSTDTELIVADSCIVALDMLEYEQSGAFEYADTDKASAAGAQVEVTG